MQTIAEIKEILAHADADELVVLDRALQADTRKGVIRALEQAHKRCASEQAERERVDGLYCFQREIGGKGILLGLDEVGRGPLAGPLVVGGVVLADEPHILGLDDSKRLSCARREEIAERVKREARAWTLQSIPPEDIDENGMAASLRRAFSAAIADIEAQGVAVDAILLDGNPLHLDSREVNIVGGDARCASISAASIIAKVARDARMVAYAQEYPGYHFESNKGYGSQEHIEAIRQLGLSPIHRRSFCHFDIQPSLF